MLTDIAVPESRDITEELESRPSRHPDYEAEAWVTERLIEEIADAPEGPEVDKLFQHLSTYLLEVTHAGSAGVSLLEVQDGEEVFRWHGAAGQLAAVRGQAVRRDVSTSDLVIRRNAPVLIANAVPHAVLPGAPPAREALLAPFHFHAVPVGTVWIVAHEASRPFEAEDLRLLTTLSRYASTVYRLLTS